MTADVDVPLPEDTPPAASPEEAIRSLGFDPAQVKVVVLTQLSAVAISVDYPEPYQTPQEA